MSGIIMIIGGEINALYSKMKDEAC
jgi:hypothetical protein